MVKDPDQDPTSSIVAQRHRRDFQETGAHFLLESESENSKNLNNIHSYLLADS